MRVPECECVSDLIRWIIMKPRLNPPDVSAVVPPSQPPLLWQRTDFLLPIGLQPERLLWAAGWGRAEGGREVGPGGQWPSLFHSRAWYGHTILFLDLYPSVFSHSATTHPAFWHPLYLRGKADIHCLCGVIWGHAHSHHLAQRWPAHNPRLRFWSRNRDQRIHELFTNL